MVDPRHSQPAINHFVNPFPKLYKNCTDDELRGFVTNRLILSPAEAWVSSKDELSNCLWTMDQEPAFDRFMDLPAALRCDFYDRVLDTPFRVSRTIQAKAEPQLYQGVKICFHVFWTMCSECSDDGEERWHERPDVHCWVTEQRSYQDVNQLDFDGQMVDKHFLGIVLNAKHSSFMLAPRADSAEEFVLREHRVLADISPFLQDNPYLKTAEIVVSACKGDKQFVPPLLEKVLWQLALLPAKTDINSKGLAPATRDRILQQRIVFQAGKAESFRGISRSIIAGSVMTRRLGWAVRNGLRSLKPVQDHIDRGLKQFLGAGQWLEGVRIDQLATMAKPLKGHVDLASKVVDNEWEFEDVSDIYYESDDCY